MNKTHKHIWKEAYTETKDGTVLRSYLHCQNKPCDETKIVDGKFEKEFNNTWAGYPAHITK